MVDFIVKLLFSRTLKKLIKNDTYKESKNTINHITF